MNKLFEVPYNFNLSLVRFYKKNSRYISYIFLPPYKDDLINTRTSIETKKKGRCYMPQSRKEYENHLKEIVSACLPFIVLWQEPNSVITKEQLDYYSGLGVSGFIIANDMNAKIIKQYNSDLVVVGSLVQRISVNIQSIDLTYYDSVVLYYPINRALDVLKHLSLYKNKIIIMPNTFCHIDCPSMHHWFPSTTKPFVQKRDCMVLRDSGRYISRCGFISPEHLTLFDDYVSGYKLQGREYTTELLKYICTLYFERMSPKDLLVAMLGEELATNFLNYQKSMDLHDYYNLKTKEINNMV